MISHVYSVVFFFFCNFANSGYRVARLVLDESVSNQLKNIRRWNSEYFSQPYEKIVIRKCINFLLGNPLFLQRSFFTMITPLFPYTQLLCMVQLLLKATIYHNCVCICNISYPGIFLCVKIIKITTLFVYWESSSSSCRVLLSLKTVKEECVGTN